MKKNFIIFFVILWVFLSIFIIPQMNLKYGSMFTSHIDELLVWSKKKISYWENADNDFVKKYVSPDGFEIIAHRFTKNSEYVYHDFFIIDSADSKTFEHIDGLFAADENHYFHWTEIIAKKSEDFEYLWQNYYKKNNKIFYVNTEIKNVDIESFKVVEHFVVNDGPYGNQFAYDDFRTYLRGEEIEKLDWKTLKFIWDSIIIDKYWVYWNTSGIDYFISDDSDLEIFWIDYVSFEEIFPGTYRSGIFKDKNTLYYQYEWLRWDNFLPIFTDITEYGISSQECLDNLEKCYIYLTTGKQELWTENHQDTRLEMYYEEKQEQKLQEEKIGKKCYIIENNQVYFQSKELHDGEIITKLDLLKHADAETFQESEWSNMSDGCYATDKNFVFKKNNIFYANEIIYLDK